MRQLITMALLVTLASLAVAQETKISGFADASYFYDANAEAGEFGVDQVEIDVIHQASQKTMVRADLEWVKNDNGFDVQVEQAFMEYKRDCGTSIIFGQFNAPIGFELLDAPDMYQYSHSLVFDHGLPTNLTGLALSRQLTDLFDVIAYATNGWDANTEDNENLTFGGRFGYTAPYGLTVGFSGISGKELLELEADSLDDDGTATGEVVLATSAATRTVFDIDLGYERGSWTLGGEFNLGKVTLGDDREFDWTGYLVMAHYDVNDWLGFTARYDTFDDADGFVFATKTFDDDDGLAFGAAEKRSSLTFAPTFVLDDGFGALVEFRLDMSDQDSFEDRGGDLTDSALSVAFEMTYSW